MLRSAGRSEVPEKTAVSGTDSAVIALRLQKCAETDEEKAAADALYAACRDKLRRALQSSGGSVDEAARALSSHPRSLYRLIVRYDLHAITREARAVRSHD